MNVAAYDASNRAVKMFGTVQRALVLFLLATTPLVVAGSFTLDGHNIPKLALLMVGVPLATALRGVERALGGRAFRIGPIWIPAVASTAPLVLAWAASPHRAWALWGESTRLQGLLPYLVVVAFGILLYDAWAQRPVAIAGAVATSGAAAGAVATYQMLFGGSTIDQSSTSGYVTATLGHSNFAGGFLAIAMPVAVILWLWGGWWKWPGIVCTALIFDGLLFTNSQGGWVAAIGALGIVLGMRAAGRGLRPVRIGMWIAAAAAAINIGIVIVSLLIPSLASRYPVLDSAYGRALLWTQAVDLTAERPFVGWGPNAFALEAPLRRPVVDALSGGLFYGDDPHSVPLSMAANAGLAGVIGYAAIFVWALRRVIRDQAWRSDRRRLVLTAAFLGGLTAYALQAFVSLDEIALRLELWACLAGIAAMTRPAEEQQTAAKASRARPRPWATWLPVAVASLVIAGWAAWSVLPPDHAAIAGARAIQAGRVEAGSREIRSAIETRDAFEYRRVYAETLGREAVEWGSGADELIAEMNRQFTNLDLRGDPHAVRDQARLLHAWSEFDPSADEHALTLYREALRRDPYNPPLAALASDVMVALGRYDEAARLLRRFVPLLTERYPLYELRYEEYWGALAVVEAQMGEREAALDAIRRSERIEGDECRTLIAEQLLMPPDQRVRPTGIGFICPPVLLRLLPEDPA